MKDKTKIRSFLALFTVISLLLFSGCTGKKEIPVEGEEGKLLYEDGLALYKKRRYKDAIERFKKVTEDYPFGPYVADSTLLIADSHYYNKGYEDASTYYTDFVNLYPAHLQAPYALYQKGMSFYKEILSIDRDQSVTKKALLVFQELQSRYPNSTYNEKAEELIKECKKRLAERELYVGLFYMKNKNYRGAITRLQEVIKMYPESGLTDEALFNTGKAYLKLKEDELAKEVFTTLISTYPESKFIKNLKGLNLKEPLDFSGVE